MILANKFSLYVTSTTAGNVPALELQKTVTEFVLDEMTQLFGGATIISAIGAFRMADGTIVKEEINIVSSSAIDLSNIEEMYKLARKVCNRMTQESVALEINGELHLVEANQLQLVA